MQRAVHAEADGARVLERFEVNVAGPDPQRLFENLIDRADDVAVLAVGGGLVQLQHLLVVQTVDLLALLVLAVILPAGNELRPPLGSAVEAFDRLFHHRERSDQRTHGQAGEQLQLVDHQQIVGADESHVQHIPAYRHRRQQPVAAKLLRQQTAQRRVGGDFAGRPRIHRHDEVLGIRLGDLRIGSQARS